MNGSPRRADLYSVVLEEHRPKELGTGELPRDFALQIWEELGDQVSVDFPSPKTGGKWKLTPGGWVGHAPVGHVGSVRIEPKVPIHNLFRMLEQAYDLEAFRLPPQTVSSGSIEDLFSELARILALRVLARTRQGLHRDYEEKTERLPYIRGRLDLRSLIQPTAELRHQCHFDEHTADLEDNQILLWTLRRILRTGIPDGERERVVKQAQRALQGRISLSTFGAADCRDRNYSRLNTDYKALHALCRFFLDSSGPVHRTGADRNLPFMIGMPRLFELFVARWLRTNSPSSLKISDQVDGTYDPAPGEIRYRVDLVVRGANDRPLMVIDTKYKTTTVPAASDVAQVVSYALSLQCTEAVLLYPHTISDPVDFTLDGIRVRARGLDLSGDPERAMDGFLTELQQELRQPVDTAI